MSRGGQITGISGTTQTARYEVTVTQPAGTDKVALDTNLTNASSIAITISSVTVAGTVDISNSAPITVNVTAGIVNITATLPLTVNVTNNLNITNTVVITGVVNISNTSPITVNVTGTVAIAGSVNISASNPITVNVTNALVVAGTVSISNSSPLTVNVTNTITVSVTSTSTLFVYEQALNSGTYGVVAITSTAIVEITAIANQALLEMYPLSTGRVYWAFTSAITPSSVASFKKISPFIRPCKNSIFVMVTASGGINLATYKWTGQ